MKLSTKGRYGLRAMIDLADYSEEMPQSIASIAARQSISDSYLEQLMAKLKKAGLITSIRGSQGGYVLAKPGTEISVGDILRALEGDLSPVKCMGLKGDQACSGSGNCVTKNVWKRIDDSIQNAVDSIYLNELVEDNRKMRLYGKEPGADCDL
ncbi:MAG: Rrf2 family transcriptional regulator [Lachnospiraceae bacterium]|nr:Rrf2 family transcriptional regulator [Lachnospiraceae bacterium]MDE6760562.1 Rrf2 family transcriptional regulator [Lachnospiraceae bacterium]